MADLFLLSVEAFKKSGGVRNCSQMPEDEVEWIVRRTETRGRAVAGAGGARQRIRTSGRARGAITAPLGFINSANAVNTGRCWL